MPKILSIQQFEDGKCGVTFEPCISDGSITLLTSAEIFKMRVDAIKHGRDEERERLNNVEREREVYAEILAELKEARKLLSRLKDDSYEMGDKLFKYFDNLPLDEEVD